MTSGVVYGTYTAGATGVIPPLGNLFDLTDVVFQIDDLNALPDSTDFDLGQFLIIAASGSVTPGETCEEDFEVDTRAGSKHLLHLASSP